MNNSSAQTNCSITSNEPIDITSLDSITISGSDYVGFTATEVITLDLTNGVDSSGYYIGGGVSNISIGNISINTTGSSGSSYTVYSSGNVGIGPVGADGINIFKFPEEWKECFPDWERIQKMCEMYPGLKIAFEKFKTTYNLVKDDYDSPPEKRIKP